MINFKQGRWSIAFVCMVLGFMLAVQFRATENMRQSVSQQRVEELATRLLETEKERDRLQEELKDTKDAATEGPSSDYLRMKGGFTALAGPGVTVTLDDSKATSKAGENPNLYLIHDDDLLRVINELRAAGAEAIAINGQRLTGTSEIRCAGPPYKIQAIGDPESLEKSIKMRGGVEDTLKVWGIQIDVKKEESVEVPAYKGAASFKYAKAIDKLSDGKGES